MSDFWTEMEEGNHVFATMDDKDICEYLDTLVATGVVPVIISNDAYNRVLQYFQGFGFQILKGPHDLCEPQVTWKGVPVVCENLGD